MPRTTLLQDPKVLIPGWSIHLNFTFLYTPMIHVYTTTCIVIQQYHIQDYYQRKIVKLHFPSNLKFKF